MNKFENFKEHLHQTAEIIMDGEKGFPKVDVTISVNGEEITFPLSADTYESLVRLMDEESEWHESHKHLEEKKMNVFELLKTGNFQARVIKSIAGFKEGMEVNIQLTNNDMVAVTDIETESIYEEFNFDTHSDYDEYFEIF